MAKTDHIRKQHVVSKFYLKGFADDSSRLHRMPLSGKPGHLISLNSATVINDFYSVTLEDGKISDFFERKFSQIEGPAAKACRKIIDEGAWPLTAEDKKALALWIALQYLRSKGVRMHETESEAFFLGLVVGVSGKSLLRDHIERAEGRPISDERLDFEWGELTQPGGPKLREDPYEHIGMLLEILPEIAARLAVSRWELSVFNLKSLVASDQPVSLLKALDHPVGKGMGIGNAGFVALPLSRKYGLTIDVSSRGTDFQTAGSTMKAKQMNQMTLDNTRECLYFHPGDIKELDHLDVQMPKRNEIDPSIGRNFIHEEGDFGAMTPQEAQVRRLVPALFHKSGKGVSLGDIAWPIERRIVVWES